MVQDKSTIVSVANMALRLRIEASWLESECEAGRLPSLLAGGRRFVNPTAVERVLAERAAITEREA